MTIVTAWTRLTSLARCAALDARILRMWDSPGSNGLCQIWDVSCHVCNYHHVRRACASGDADMTAQHPPEDVIIVDDDSAVRETLSIVFTRAGYQVVCFAEGSAFLAVARSRTPACIILDVHIPGRSGLDILKELNAEDYPAPIFIMSGQGDIPLAVEAIKYGAVDFIEKPFRGSSVVLQVREAIEAQTRRAADPNASKTPSFRFPG